MRLQIAVYLHVGVEQARVDEALATFRADPRPLARVLALVDVQRVPVKVPNMTNVTFYY